jgi:hypothetical protein
VASRDKETVSRFLDNAAQILEAAEGAVQSGHTPTDMTILITAEGQIRMVADSDWPLDSLQLHHGAKMAYRVSQSASVVRVEGRADSRTCLFETVKPERAARLLLNSSSSYWNGPLLPPAVQA